MNLSDCKSVIDFRIDSNTYKKDYLKSDFLVNSKNPINIESLSNSVQNFGAYSLCNFINFTEKGTPFLMTENVRHNYIDWNVRKYVDEKSHKMLYKSHCHKGEVLVTMAGEYLGRVAVYDKNEVCSSNQAIAKVALKEKHNSYIISTFLNTIHGQNQINRFRTITGQPNINMSLIKGLLVPEFSNRISVLVENIVKHSELKRLLSKEAYIRAEQLLLQEIGLEDFEPSHEPVNAKSFKESFGISGRLDAEYYQSKYDQLEHVITELGNYDTLGNVSELISRGKQPVYVETEDNALPVLNSKHIRENKIKLDNRRTALVGECNLFIEENDVLINGTGVGTIGRTAPYLYSTSSIPDNHVTIIRSKKVSPVYLSVYLNTVAGQLQVEKYFKGSSGQIELYPDDISNFLIWIAPEEVQKKIEEMILSAFELENTSNQLLEVAKRAVEIAIEENEEVALEYIQSNSNL